MTHDRLRHDCAWACAVSIVECLENCLREEEHDDAVHEVYRRVLAALECYDQMKTREDDRLLGPGTN